MSRQRIIVPVGITILVLGLACQGFSQWTFGVGFNGGIARLEGDLKDASLSPILSGHVRALPIPYVAINGELGYAALSASPPPPVPLTQVPGGITDFQTILIPFELNAIINFLPFGKVNPYVLFGAGGTYWNATDNGRTIIDAAGEKQEGIDSFLKTGAGLEFKVNPAFGINVGAAFRYSLTEAFDQLFQGDENDQVLDLHAGLTYYFRTGRHDRDRDLIPDELDLMPDIAEDRDGYLDHDGIPEKNPNPAVAGTFPTNNGTSPIVVHHIIQNAETGRSIPVKAFVYSDVDLRVVATLYRPLGTRNWNVVRMDNYGSNLFQGDIPGYAVDINGVEYCVVAVDQSLTGIGYSGLPSKPIIVDVSPSGKAWRIAGAAIGAATVGVASYIVLRKQD